MPKKDKRGYVMTGPQSIPVEMSEHIEKVAEKEGITKVAVLIRIIKAHMEKYKK